MRSTQRRRQYVYRSRLSGRPPDFSMLSIVSHIVNRHFDQQFTDPNNTHLCPKRVPTFQAQALQQKKNSSGGCTIVPYIFTSSLGAPLQLLPHPRLQPPRPQQLSRRFWLATPWHPPRPGTVAYPLALDVERTRRRGNEHDSCEAGRRTKCR